MFPQGRNIGRNEDFAPNELVRLHAERGEFESALRFCHALEQIPKARVKRVVA